MVNDYRRNNWSAYLYKVEDYGKKVTRVVDDSDVFGPVLSVLQDPVEPNLLWVGGEYGLYVSKRWRHVPEMGQKHANGTSHGPCLPKERKRPCLGNLWTWCMGVG